MFEELLERFESRFIPEPNSGCWLWTGPWNKQGYGRFSLSRNLPKGFTYQTQSAPRIAWYLYNNELPGDKWVLHKCDTPACVNPSHLFLGTRQDNINDMAIKGRVHRQNSTHCKYGHPLIGNNLIQRPGKITIHNLCRECGIIASANYRNKKNPNRLKRVRRRKYV